MPSSSRDIFTVAEDGIIKINKHFVKAQIYFSELSQKERDPKHQPRVPMLPRGLSCAALLSFRSHHSLLSFENGLQTDVSQSSRRARQYEQIVRACDEYSIEAISARFQHSSRTVLFGVTGKIRNRKRNLQIDFDGFKTL